MFNSSTTYARSIVFLVIVTGSIIITNFVVIDVPIYYNEILRRPLIQKMKFFLSTFHEVIKYPTEEGIREIMGDQVKARSLYNATMKEVVPK